MLKIKILVFVDWFFPGFKGGGPIRSCFNLVSMLQQGFDVKVVTRNTDFGETNPYQNIISDEWSVTPGGITVMYLSEAKISYKTIRRILVEEQPAHIYLNSMYSKAFTIFPLLVYLNNKLGGKVTLAPRGMLYPSAINHKFLKKKSYLFLMRAIKIQSRIQFHATNEREKMSILYYFKNAKMLIANNLPIATQSTLTICKKEIGTLNCVFVSRIDPIKNLLLFLEILKDIKATVNFTIIGPIENRNYWMKCQEAIRSMPSNIHIEVQGAVRNDLIETILQKAHLFVLLSEGENFGHAIFESFHAGRPVLISNQTPWNALEERQLGWDLDISNHASIRSAVESAVAWNQQEFDGWAMSSWNFAMHYLETNQNREQYFKFFS